MEPTWLEEMVWALGDRPDVGIVAARLLFVNAPGIAWDRHCGWPDDLDEPSADVFGPCAAAALHHRQVFEDVGTFDEDFFCYLEDVDLAWRAV